MHSLAVYDFLADLLGARPISAGRTQRAFLAPLAVWQRVLSFEGCAVQCDRAMRVAGLAPDAPQPLRSLLRDATSTSLRYAILAQEQLTAIAALAATCDIRVLALKGAARLLAGELAGMRSLGDIDLLVDPRDATRFHEALRRELGYQLSGSAYAHHLPGLTRARSLGIEVHRQLSHAVLPLDSAMWHDTRAVALGGYTLEAPSSTNMVLHTLEHAAGLNWMGRYRLRDILDVASVFTPDVSAHALLSYVWTSPTRAAFKTLLSAAHEIEPRVPQIHGRGWSTVRRVSRTRLALAVLPRKRLLAERVFRYAGVLAEGSPRVLARSGIALTRRGAAAALAAIVHLFSGCSDPTRSGALDVPPFVFVSDVGVTAGLYSFESGTITRLSGATNEDGEPHSAAGRIVFTSMRDGNFEIYIGGLDLAAQQRLTQDPSTDVEPALDPTGTTVAFTSNRSGTPRVWLVDASGTNARALVTGSPDFTPESGPAWSPSGTQIAFTSTRTGTSQVFLIGANGGQAIQLTHEAGGAFSPTWSADARNLLYVALVGVPRVMLIPSAGGNVTLFASDDRGLGDPACATSVCLASAGPGDGDGDIVASQGAGSATQVVLARAANERQPAFLVP